MQNRERFNSGTEWEKNVGYSRAVKAGNFIFVSGTTSVRNGKVIGAGNIELQARTCLEIIRESLEKLGGSLSDVVRTRMFVRDIGQSSAVGKVHYEFFKGITPAATMVEVNRLIDEELLIEIEADAQLEGGN